ncbi:hypothetical protein [Protofrankia symbiont of Coriaria ruscifolia]|uniref:hypothetical protein n=1 Tax=Protofrankia symbiont of Coriaria ruscifolia TaxID=1306542 RepID=UPI0010411E28|nr:hypothetical protein [Protofrankia symbiont of Coriaria ruscifolia]
MQDLLERIEARRVRAARTVERLQAEIAGLTEQLAAAHDLERLEITRATGLELSAEDNAAPVEMPPGYREVVALFEHDGNGLRAKDACRALGTDPRHVESMRAKLKRLVDRGVLTEPDPGLFVLPRPTPEINSS